MKISPERCSALKYTAILLAYKKSLFGFTRFGLYQGRRKKRWTSVDRLTLDQQVFKTSLAGIESGQG